MKKIVMYLVIFIVVCFIIPIIFSRKFVDKSQEVLGQHTDETQLNTVGNIEEGNSDTKMIRLLHKSTEQVEELSLEEYLYGVVSSEMPASFEIEALKAQAIVARTYTCYKMGDSNRKHSEADICDDSTCCQAWISKDDRFSKWSENNREEYWNKIILAVNETKGKIITYEGKPINAFFHANSGGVTELPYNVWGGSGYPYLQTVATSGEDAYTQYASEVVLNKKEFENKIKEKHSNLDIDFNLEDSIKITEYTEGRTSKNNKSWKFKLIRS
ncbi:MAG: SpoIID/LytB domain-containing protein [Clostridia bacterium]|nr:SpoIID/LytB domain-containing protein [Clostridia bacterium]